jgi:DNA-binding IclR family transcriptional regulator
VAAPVRDSAKQVVGAIGVIGPAFRLSVARLEGEVAPRVRAAAQHVSKRLGYAVVPG